LRCEVLVMNLRQNKSVAAVFVFALTLVHKASRQKM